MKNGKRIENPKDFFEDLGGLHDARINKISWNKGDSTLLLSIDDLNSNFLGLPEYKGEKPAEFLFHEVKTVDLNLQILDETYGIYDTEASSEGESLTISIKCSPGGSIKCVCSNIFILEGS